MRINSIQNYNTVRNNNLNSNVRAQKANNNVAFGKLVGQVAADAFGSQVQKNVNRFMTFMQDLTNKAIASDTKAQETLRALIGDKAANALMADKEGYTKALDKKVTKTLPLSGKGTRGESIRNKIADSLGIERTAKSDIPLPAVLGKTADGKDLYLTTTNNELLHMMEAGTLSPFEKLEWIPTEKSDGDTTVIIEGLYRKIIPNDRPLLFTYTDDIGTKGFEDYSSLVEKAQELGANSDVKVISRGHMAEKKDAAGVLGTFIKKTDGKGFEVIEKPSIEVLDSRIPGNAKVATNIGKTLITPKGLADIEARTPATGCDLEAAGNTLIKWDTTENSKKWHMTEGILKPAGAEGTLDVIEKHAQFSDIGNGEIFTDVMSQISDGSFAHVFPEKLEAQIRDNVKLASDGLSATLNYNGKIVELPTTKARAAAQEAAPKGAKLSLEDVIAFVKKIRG